VFVRSFDRSFAFSHYVLVSFAPFILSTFFFIDSFFNNSQIFKFVDGAVNNFIFSFLNFFSSCAGDWKSIFFFMRVRVCLDKQIF